MLEDRTLRRLGMRSSSERDIAKLRALASKIPSAEIAAKLEQSLQTPAVAAHHPKSPLKVKPEDSWGKDSNLDPGPSGFAWPNERGAKRKVRADRRKRGSAAPVGRPRINFDAAAALKKWPSIGNERARASLFPYIVIDGTLDACIREFLTKPPSQRHSYEIHTVPQAPVITPILYADQITEIAWHWTVL
jgi:hypothetical protein